MKDTLSGMNETEIIEMYKTLADKALDYESSFESYREEMYRQMSQRKINWLFKQDLASMYMKLSKQDLVDFFLVNFWRDVDWTSETYVQDFECKKSVVYLYKNQTDVPQ